MEFAESVTRFARSHDHASRPGVEHEPPRSGLHVGRVGWLDDARREAALLHKSEEVMTTPIFRTSQIFTDIGKPRSGILFSADALTNASVFCCKAMTKRVDALDKQIESAASESVFWPLIQGLMALRGVNLLTATMTVAEIGDLKRFASAPQLMAYLGVVPSEHSSGATKSRGGITKTGNGHVRRVLVEAAWTYRHPARKTASLQRRAERTPEVVQEIAWNAQKTNVRALQAARRPRQTQGASVHGHRA